MTVHRTWAWVLPIAAVGMLALGACGGNRAAEPQPPATAAIQVPTTTLSVRIPDASADPMAPTDAPRSPGADAGLIATVTTTQAQTTTTTPTSTTPPAGEAAEDPPLQPLPDIDEETDEFSDLDTLLDELDALLADLAAGWTDNEGDVNP